MREKVVEKYLVDQLKTRGIECVKFLPPPKGFPDRIVLLPNEVLFVELKSPIGKLSVAQENWQKKMQELALSHTVLATLEEIDKFLIIVDERLKTWKGDVY